MTRFTRRPRRRGPILLSLLLSACAGPAGSAWTNPVTLAEEAGPIPSRWAGDHASGEGVTLVRATTDGVPGWFVLDSGSEVVILDRSFADALGLEVARSLPIGECRIRAGLRRSASFKVGPLEFDDPFFLTLDLGPFLEEVEDTARIVGIIGRPILEHAVVEVEYGEGSDRVSMYSPEAYAAEHPWTPSRWPEGRPTVELALDGTRGWFAVDTGKSGTVSVASHFASSRGLPGDRHTEPTENRRLCGTSDEQSAGYDVELAGRAIPDVDVRFRLPGTEAARAESDAYAGVLGRELLKDFTLVLDFARQRLYLEPRGGVE